MDKKYLNRFKKILEIYGNSVEIEVKGQKFNVKAFIQPVRYTNKMYIDYDRTEIGISNNSRFVYIGPSTPNITHLPFETIIRYNGREYSLKRADKIGFERDTAYILGILAARVGDEMYEYI